MKKMSEPMSKRIRLPWEIFLLCGYHASRRQNCPHDVIWCPLLMVLVGVEITPPPPLVTYQAPASSAARLWDVRGRMGAADCVSPMVLPSSEGAYQLLRLVAMEPVRKGGKHHVQRQIASAPLASATLNSLVRQAPLTGYDWERQHEAKDFLPRTLRNSTT